MGVSGTTAKSIKSAGIIVAGLLILYFHEIENRHTLKPQNKKNAKKIELKIDFFGPFWGVFRFFGGLRSPKLFFTNFFFKQKRYFKYASNEVLHVFLQQKLFEL